MKIISSSLFLLFMASICGAVDTPLEWRFNDKATLKKMYLYCQPGQAAAKLSFDREENTGADCSGCLRVDIVKSGESINHIQLQNRVKMTLRPKARYQLAFRAKSSSPAMLDCRVIGIADRKFKDIAIRRFPLPAGQWRDYTVEFLGQDKYDNLLLPTFFLGDMPQDTRFHLDFISLTCLDQTESRAAVLIDLKPVANMSYADPVAGDGVGGWSDQGPTNDAAGFDFRRQSYLDIPFQVIDPLSNKGKSVLTFYSAQKFPQGLKDCAVNVNARGKFLYLLHTVAWGNGKWRGEIKLTGDQGKTQTLTLVYDRDVRDQWNPYSVANGIVVSEWQNGGGARSGIYLSQFPIDAEMGTITRIGFSSTSERTIWMVLAATISDGDIANPRRQQRWTVTANTEWQALKRTASPRVVPGSALDLGMLNSGKIERVIINSNGRLAFASAPDIPSRFFCTSTVELSPERLRPRDDKNPDFNWKTAIDELTAELRRAGYNMYKLSLPGAMIKVVDGRAEVNPEVVDFIDYLVFSCKENGIYLMLNAALNNCPFSGISAWSKAGSEAGEKQFSMFNIIYQESERLRWATGMESFLLHDNPYTKTRLADDPVLAIITCYNEQEFAYIKGGPGQEKYSWNAGIDAWRKYINNPNVPMFTREDWERPDENGRRINDFITFQWRNMYSWYRDTLNKIGYRGITTLWDMGKSMHYNNLRFDVDLITMHSYHALSIGSDNALRVNQSSDLAAGAAQARYSASTRIAGKPFFINEYGTIFPNRYRYEESFSFAAYAALQGYDGIMRHNHNVNSFNCDRIHAFAAYWDPIARSQQTTAALIFARGDVSEASSGVRITFSEAELSKNGRYHEAGAIEQSRLALILKYGLERDDRKNEDSVDLRLPLSGSARVINRAWESTIGSGKPVGIDKTLALLKSRKLIPADNRSEGYFLSASVTGELFLDASAPLMTINTPRFQGMAAPAGKTASFADTVLENVSADASLCLAAIDGLQPISAARRLLVVYATNALNSGMVFDDQTMTHMRYWGGNPTLVKTGSFRVRLKTPHAPSLRLWILEMNGERRAELPLQRGVGEISFTIDTATLPEGPALYFELSL